MKFRRISVAFRTSLENLEVEDGRVVKIAESKWEDASDLYAHAVFAAEAHVEGRTELRAPVS